MNSHDEWSTTTTNLPIATKMQHFEESKEYYREWLVLERLQHKNPYTQAAQREYAQRAAKPLLREGKLIFTFAPVARQLSAIFTITRGQGLALGLALIALGLAFGYRPLTTLTVLFALLTTLYFINLLINTVAIMRVILRSPEGRIDEQIIAALGDDLWPSYTILCPLYHEAEIVPQFVQAMEALDYPHQQLQVLFLIEADDQVTHAAIAAMHLPPHFQIVVVPDGYPRTKPRACNYGLIHSTGQFIVIFDAEDIPDPRQLKKAVLTFANHSSELACVQAKLGFYNPQQNMLTRWFALEYALWFNFILPGMQGVGLSLPLGGTSNHFRTALLRRIGGWDPFNVTEDCDLGLRLAQYHLYTAVLDSLTQEEANSNGRNWLRQRSRWTKGYFQTYLVHMRSPWKFLSPKRWREFISLQLIIGASPAMFFINPIMWVLLGVYIGFRSQVESLYSALYFGPLYYMALTCLIFGNFLYIYIYFLAAARTKQYGLMIAVPLIVVYWLMMSVAAVIALYQLIVKPHFWEKTKHGLHLKQAVRTTASAP